VKLRNRQVTTGQPTSGEVHVVGDGVQFAQCRLFPSRADGRTVSELPGTAQWSNWTRLGSCGWMKRAGLRMLMMRYRMAITPSAMPC
jgi:hypothetical protein